MVSGAHVTTSPQSAKSLGDEARSALGIVAVDQNSPRATNSSDAVGSEVAESSCSQAKID